MKTLSTQDTLTYLKHAIDLESAIITQKQIIEAYEASAEERKPILVEEKPKFKCEPWKPNCHESIPILFIIVGIVCGIFPFYCFSIFGQYCFNGAMLFWSFILLGFSYFSIRGGINAGRTLANYQSALKASIEYNKQEQKRVDAFNEASTKSHQKDLAEWTASNLTAHAHMDLPLQETKSTLSQLYAMDVIYPKYRNLPALTCIYEYLITGRCSELTGSHGAYNLYEDELRKDTIISQLNTIIENLEQIKYNQYMLYEQVKGIRENTAVIAAELNQIRGYTAVMTELTALNTYYNGISARNSAVIAYLND